MEKSGFQFFRDKIRSSWFHIHVNTWPAALRRNGMFATSKGVGINISNDITDALAFYEDFLNKFEANHKDYIESHSNLLVLLNLKELRIFVSSESRSQFVDKILIDENIFALNVDTTKILFAKLIVEKIISVFHYNFKGRLNSFIDDTINGTLVHPKSLIRKIPTFNIPKLTTDIGTVDDFELNEHCMFKQYMRLLKSMGIGYKRLGSNPDEVTIKEIRFRQKWIEKIREAVLSESKDLVRLVFTDSECGSLFAKEYLSLHNHDQQNIISFGAKALSGLRNSKYAAVGDLDLIPKLYFIPNLSNAKDAADINLSREVYYYNDILPSDIDFLIISRDGFADELALTCRVKRNCAVTKFDDDHNKLEYSMERLSQEIELSMAENEEDKPEFYKESRLTKIAKNKDDGICNKFRDNAFPCNNPRWHNLETCYDHTWAEQND
tara:strand:- start:47812 stop:49125 length:1314 start_codon:yes stop_codon:yes gene_type:complete